MGLRPLLLIGLLATVASATDKPAEKCSDQTSMFECANKKCIPRIWTCDNDNDCGDGSDEINCKPYGEIKCNSNEFNCPVHTVQDLQTQATCIPKSWQCDGEPDCAGREDEFGCPNVTCKPGTFACESFGAKTITCAPLSWKCDGQVDCSDQSDEKDCTKKTCNEETEFQCTLEGNCISKNWRCDGDQDCFDGSDEKDCQAQSDCKTDKTRFACKTNNFCIPVAWRCDGERDCLDSSDELDCTDDQRKSLIHVNCSANYWKCKSGNQCIKKEWVCDGDYDCHDSSDEQDCTRNKCKPNEFSCDLGLCRSASVRCNGIEDCLDGSDEFNCNIEKNLTSCNATQFSCPGTPLQCIELNEFCSDANKDCADPVCGKDQLFCTKGAKHCTCHKGYAKSSVCRCDDGFKRNGDQCEDINECDELGICDQKCINLIGSYECKCHHGYHLVHSKRLSAEGKISIPSKCKANGSDPLLFISNRVTIRKYDLVTKNIHALVSKLESAVAMDYWHKEKTLIWSDVAKEKIMICHMGDNLELNDTRECKADQDGILINDVVTPDGLAVDWVHGLLFWTDTGLNQINVMNLTSKQRKTIVDTGLDEPRAIAVDPSQGVIFWTDWGNSKIERSGMDGQDRKTIVSGNNVKWPNGLTLDMVTQRVYWADAKLKMISSCDYHGNDVRIVLRDHYNLKHPFSLTVFEERLYWTDWEHDGVLTVNKFNGKDIATIIKGVRGPMTVRVYHEMVQPTLQDKCSLHLCDQLCLPRSRFVADTAKDLPYSCACDRNHNMEHGSCISMASSNAMTQESSYAGSIIMFLTLFVVCGFVAVGYRFYRRPSNRFSALNFDNPVYRHTVEVDAEADMDSLENPVIPAPTQPDRCS